MRSLRPLALTTAALLLMAGCSDDPADSAGAEKDAAPAGSAPGSLDAPIVELTSTDVCERLEPTTVGRALGIEVSAISPATGDATPQCSYSYVAKNGSLNSVAVSALRAGDVGSAGTLDEGFDVALKHNRDLAPDAKKLEGDAGERSVVLDGSAHDVGILAQTGHLLTVLVTDRAIKPKTTDEFLAVVADTFSADR